MKKEEQIQQSWFPAIKGSTRDLISAAGGIDRISLFLKCSKSLVGNWNNWESADLMPAWAMIALEADLGRPILSAAYARLTGASVHDPIGTAKRMNTLAMETALLMQEVVEFAGAHAEASADGEYDIVELRGLRQRLVDIGDEPEYRHCRSQACREGRLKMGAAINRAVWPLDDNQSNDDLVRESQAARVRQLMSEGLSLPEIAERLGISEAEVREWMDAGRVVP